MVLVMFRGDNSRTVSEIGVSGMIDWFSGERISGNLTLEPRTSRILVSES